MRSALILRPNVGVNTAPPAERSRPRRLAYSNDFSQWVALVNNIPALASRLSGLNIANVLRR
jgi:hypothetical protein